MTHLRCARHSRRSSTSSQSAAGRIRVPLPYADELYALRHNIRLVRERL